MARDYVPIEKIRRALQRFPDGATTLQVAEVLGMNPHNLSSRLTKQFMYGKGVSRDFKPGSNAFIWRIEQ